MRRIVTTRASLLIASVAISVGLAPTMAAEPTAAQAAFVGSQTLTFDTYGEGTPITDQYEAQGVLFSGATPDEPPFIASDIADPTSPVLAGFPEFHGPIHAEFVLPGTAVPTTVSGLALDVGYINDPGSVQLTIDTTTGPEVISANEEGIDELESAASNISGFVVEEVSTDANGYAIDNLSFTPGTPPPPPVYTPPPAPPPPANPCVPSPGSLAHRILASIKCTAHLTALEAECGVAVFALIDLPLKSLKLVEAAKAGSVIDKLPAKLRPAAKWSGTHLTAS